MPKKNRTKKCSDRRIISLFSHTRQSVAFIVLKIENKIKEVIEDQFGFRKGEDTRDAIGLMRNIGISVRLLDFKEGKCYWQMVSDCFDWTKLLEIFKNIVGSWRERRVIRHLYMGKKVKLPLNQGETNSVEIRRGVRQGCCLSPILFHCMENI